MAEARIDRHFAVVEQDLPDIYTFIAEHDPAAAERVLDAVEETFRQLARHPDSGVPSGPLGEYRKKIWIVTRSLNNDS